MALTKIGSIGINTGIAFAGVTTIVTLNASDNVLSVGGTVNFVSDVSIGGTVSIAGTLTYEDVTNVDAVGLITARDGIKVGSGITLSVDGDGFFTGVVTATTFSGTFSGDGTSLTGVASTDDIRTNTNARFLQNISLGDVVPRQKLHISASDSGAANMVFTNTTTGTAAADGFIIGITGSEDAQLNMQESANLKFNTSDTTRATIEPTGNINVTQNVKVAGVVTATSFEGSGANLTGISVGVQTEAASISGITTYLDLTKDDHELVVTGSNTISVIGGSQGTSHTLRLQNSGIATVTLDSTYFKFPSGASPAFPTTDGSISLVSFTVHKAGAVGVNTVLLTGASVSFS